MEDAYSWADESFNSSPKFSMGFAELLSTKPYFISPVVMKQYEEQHAIIRKFQETVICVFREALSGKRKSKILNWLINETPASLGIRYHKSLTDKDYSTPVFFRTDEVAPGHIVEIQCPGSLWGELQLTYNFVKKLGYTGDEPSPAEKFNSQLKDYLKELPIVQHLLDSSSAPAGMRYFIECTRPAIKYWGIDRGIKPKDCNFIRGHSFYQLCADNDFKRRLSDRGDKIKYDLPKHILFDQKASLVLPFWSLTRDFFTDDIRNILLYSTPLLPSGIELPDHTKISVSRFSKLPQSSRNFFLKYAGMDVSINWGAKAVFRLSNLGSNACLELLNNCLSGFDRGQIWLLQQERKQDDKIAYFDRSGSIVEENLRAKLSAFYGPESCIGVIAMHRHNHKVHGQEDTVLSYVMPECSSNYSTNH